jgi:outer membrane receptor protein involved in Fe transport
LVDQQHEVIEGRGSENSLNLGIFGDTAPLNSPIFFEKGVAKGDGDVHGGSAFGDANWEFVSTLKLALGARYTKELQRYAGYTYFDADNQSLFPFPYFALAGLLKQNYRPPAIADPAALVAFLTGLNPTVPRGAGGSLNAQGNAGLFTGWLSEHIATLEHDPLYDLAAHRIWDVRLAFAPDNRPWILSLYGRNIGNEFYRSSVIKLGDSVFAYTGQPASYGVSLVGELALRPLLSLLRGYLWLSGKASRRDIDSPDPGSQPRWS